MAWQIKFADSAKKEMAKIDKQIAKRVVAFLRERIVPSDNPRSIGEALEGSKLGQLWKYRVGDYRVIVDIEDEVLCVVVVRIAHRREAYRH